jgi:hypothetical protein
MRGKLCLSPLLYPKAQERAISRKMGDTLFCYESLNSRLKSPCTYHLWLDAGRSLYDPASPLLLRGGGFI